MEERFRIVILFDYSDKYWDARARCANYTPRAILCHKCNAEVKKFLWAIAPSLVVAR